MAEVATPPAPYYSQNSHMGKYAHLYQPPSSNKSPGLRGISDQLTQGDYFTSGSRKRLRAESSLATSNGQPPRYRDQRHTPGPRTDDDDSSLVFSTDSLLVNDQYTLKGGFDTPGLFANTDDRVNNVDTDTRRRIRELDLNVQSTEPAFAGPLAKERNGLARPQIDFTSDQTYHNSSPSWTRLALTLPFSIAGKMFSFGGAVLKGFYAGGGQGYEIDENGKAISSTARDRSLSNLGPGTPVPGAWRESPPRSYDNGNDDRDAFEGDFEQDNPQSLRPPPNKRRLTDKDTWVMVRTPDIETATPTSPKRNVHSVTTPRLSRPSMPRNNSRRSIHGTPKRHSYITSAGSPALNHTFSPQSNNNGTKAYQESPHSRQHSFARQSSPSHIATPMSPETEKLRRRQAKQERVAERTMSNMSRQLEELIRQGQEALGTRFTVESNGDVDDDEAFVDED